LFEADDGLAKEKKSLNLFKLGKDLYVMKRGGLEAIF